MIYRAFLALLVVGMMFSSQGQAETAQVRIYTDGQKRCIESNGVPNHARGQLPNRGNPHRFRTQRLKFCFDAKPAKRRQITRRTPNVGIALNGIVIRPGTADWYDRTYSARCQDFSS